MANMHDEAFIRGLFDDIDEDGSGCLDRGEIAELARKLTGKALTKRQLDAAMEEMDGDGNGEIDFGEFKEWWDTAQEKGSELMTAMNARWEKAQAAVRAARAKEKEATEAQRALGAVAKSHGTLIARMNKKDQMNRKLKDAAGKLVQQLKDADAEAESDRLEAKEAQEAQKQSNEVLREQIAVLEKENTILGAELEAEERRRVLEVRSLSTSHDEMEQRLRRKDLRIEALVAQVGGVDQRVASLRFDVKNERERTAQVQLDMERATEKLSREKQLEVSRREDQITRLLGTLERLRQKEGILLEELRLMSEKKDAYRAELRGLKKMINGATRAGRQGKADADKGTFFTVVR